MNIAGFGNLVACYPRVLAPLRAPGVVLSGSAPPLSALIVSFLVRFLRGPSRPAVARVVCTVRAWSRLVSSSSWSGRDARVCRLVMSCWLFLPSPLDVPVISLLPSPFPAALPCHGAALSPPPPRARPCRQWPQRPPAKFRRGMYRWSRAPWLCAAAEHGRVS